VRGSPGDIAQIAGEWRGTYESPGTRMPRTGSILFRLAAEQDTAVGEVLMVLREPGAPLSVREADPVHAGAAAGLLRRRGNQLHFRRFDVLCPVMSTIDGRTAGRLW
jgi:hypothetical protein